MKKYYKTVVILLIFVLGVRLECSESGASVCQDSLPESEGEEKRTFVPVLWDDCCYCNPGQGFIGLLLASQPLIEGFGVRLEAARYKLVKKALARLAELSGQVRVSGAPLKRGRGQCDCQKATLSLPVESISTGPCNGQVEPCLVGTGNPEIDLAIELGQSWPVKFMSEAQYEQAIARGAKIVCYCLGDLEQVKIRKGDFLVVLIEHGYSEAMFILQNDGQADIELDGERLGCLHKNPNLTRIVGLKWTTLAPEPVDQYNPSVCWVLDPNQPPEDFFHRRFHCLYPFLILRDGEIDLSAVYCAYFTPIFNKCVIVQMHDYRAVGIELEDTDPLLRSVDPSRCPSPNFKVINPEE